MITVKDMRASDLTGSPITQQISTFHHLILSRTIDEKNQMKIVDVTLSLQADKDAPVIDEDASSLILFEYAGERKTYLRPGFMNIQPGETRILDTSIVYLTEAAKDSVVLPFNISLKLDTVVDNERLRFININGHLSLLDSVTS